MGKCVVIGGAGIENYEQIRPYLKKDDFNIFCDCGLRHMNDLNIQPNLIVGDFDSYQNPGLKCETIVLPREKDDTDTVFGVKEGIRRGYREFLLIGMIGQRLDHSLGNLYILLKLDALGLKGMIADDYSEMEIISGKPAFVEDRFPYFSLLNISGTARNIVIENAKYPLNGAEITCEYQFGISNEVIPGKCAKVTVGEGKLLLIRNR